MDDLTAYYQYHTPKGTQAALTGDDWLSERDKKAQVRAEAKRKAAALACIKKLEAAADSLNEYLSACMDCHDGSGSEVRGTSDSRIIMTRNLMEYSTFLASRYDKTN